MEPDDNDFDALDSDLDSVTDNEYIKSNYQDSYFDDMKGQFYD